MAASILVRIGTRQRFLALSGLLIANACWFAEAPPAPVDLRAAERSVFSQFGEDGVIEKIFEIIEPGPRFTVEFGAHDGINNSNMRNLVVNHGWSSFQIEGDERAQRRSLARRHASADPRQDRHREEIHLRSLKLRAAKSAARPERS